MRFLVEAADSNGSASVFECFVPADSKMPAPHSHDAFEETIYGLEGTTTGRSTAGHSNSPRRSVLRTSRGCPWIRKPRDRRRQVPGDIQSGRHDAGLLPRDSRGAGGNSRGPAGPSEDRGGHAPARPNACATAS